MTHEELKNDCAAKADAVDQAVSDFNASMDAWIQRLQQDRAAVGQKVAVALGAAPPPKTPNS